MQRVNYSGIIMTTASQSLLPMDHPHDDTGNGVFLNELCLPTQALSGCVINQHLTTRLVDNQLHIFYRHYNCFLKR